MSLYQAAGDSGGGRTLARRDDDPHPMVAASSHGPPSRVHHKANEKPVGGRSHTITDRSELWQKSCETQCQRTAKGSWRISLTQQLEVTTVESHQTCTELTLREKTGRQLGFGGRKLSLPGGKEVTIGTEKKQ